VTLALLDQELHEVSEWFGLGLHLGVPVADLQAVQYNPTLRSIPQFRTEMLTARMRKLPELSWSLTVLALMAVGRESLAQKIALKYGEPSTLAESNVHCMYHTSLIRIFSYFPTCSIANVHVSKSSTPSLYI